LSTGDYNVGLMNEYNNSYYTSPQYYAAKEANNKIHKYGTILNNCTWFGADSIMTFSPSFDLSCVLLDSLYVPLITNSPLYQGYVQAGFYKNANSEPHIMLVNRRAIQTQANLMSISPVSYPPLVTYNNSYTSAEPQTVRLFPSDETGAVIGTDIAFYDPFDSTLYKALPDYADVEIGPGDGRLLQMVGTLRSNPVQNSVIYASGYLQGSITVSGNVTFTEDSDVTMLPNTSITINSGGSLTVNGDLHISADCHITVNQGGTLTLNTLNTFFPNTAGIDVHYGEININNSNLTFFGDTGILGEASTIRLSNSEFRFDYLGRITNYSSGTYGDSGSIIASNCSFTANPGLESWFGFSVMHSSCFVLITALSARPGQVFILRTPTF